MTYVVALLLVAALGAGFALTAVVWSQSSQRDKEAELIWIGNQFKQAIALYYLRTPGAVPRYPERLEDLLEDRRYPSVQRYLRRIFTDPMTKKAQWGTVLSPSGGIMGVRSFSSGQPVRTIAGAATYADWKFIYEPPVSAQPSQVAPKQAAASIAPKTPIR